MLKANGIKAAAYHARYGESRAHDRARVQEAFAEEQLDVVVATVAFGMGIDRSNVRCVVHAAMPKTVEHYQQETGRAGRDGLEAECIMFYSAGRHVFEVESIDRSSALRRSRMMNSCGSNRRLHAQCGVAGAHEAPVQFGAMPARRAVALFWPGI